MATTSPSPHVWSRLGSEEAVTGTHWMWYQEPAKFLQESQVAAVHYPEDLEAQLSWSNPDLEFGGCMFENYDDGAFPPLFQLEGANSTQAERHRDERLAGLVVESMDQAREKAVREKRHRSKDWSSAEKSALLDLKVEALKTVDSGTDWDFISRMLLDRYRFQRNPKNCENQWGTLLKAYRAIGQHEVSAGDKYEASTERPVISFWKMSADERSRNKLPRVFTVEWCTAMDYIFARQAKGKRSKTKNRSSSAQEFLTDGDDSLHHDVDLVPDPVGERSNPHGKQPHMTNCAGMPHSINQADAEGLPVNRAKLVDEAVNAALQRLRDSGKANSPATPEEYELAKKLSLLIKRAVEDVISSELQRLAPPKKPGGTVDEDSLVAKLAPFIKDQVENAVSSSLKPIYSVLELLKQEERKFEKDVQAIAEKKRTTSCEENLLQKRQRVGRQRTTRGAKQHVAAVRKNNGPSADKVIPALQGMRIGRDEDRSNNVPEAT